jgi:phosphoribosylformimino-5-aminoimidazole carboxamide ribotide isomerase
MLIFPAIDLLEGRCVRLRQGRFDEAKVYSDDPAATARGFVAQGAEALHVVDLEGARLGKAKNLDSIQRIRDAAPVFLQVGGGIRTFALATRMLEAGVDRIVCGTAAADDPRLVSKLLARFGPDSVAAAIDLRGDRVAVRGWEAESERGLEDVARDLRAAGARWIVCTDVSRDGALAGPSLDAARRLLDEGFQVIVAGGVTTTADVACLRELGAAGCVIGSALYEGALTLADALESARAH